MANDYILMGDIVSSRQYKGGKLNQAFSHLVSYCNRELSAGILSPYTITLGDEFQGIAGSLRSAIESIFCIEEACLRSSISFKLRFVLLYGRIDTPINKRIAHGMMGPGLLKAREILNNKKRGAPRFRFALPDQKLTLQLSRLFSVLESLISEWHEKDFSLIADMLANDNNDEVGKKHGKNRSQIWKRRKSLRINEYKTINKVIFDFIE